jgi:hypothetical protein
MKANLELFSPLEMNLIVANLKLLHFPLEMNPNLKLSHFHLEINPNLNLMVADLKLLCSPPEMGLIVARLKFLCSPPEMGLMVARLELLCSPREMGLMVARPELLCSWEMSSMQHLVLALPNQVKGNMLLGTQNIMMLEFSLFKRQITLDFNHI